jgi:hypothetical protein
MSVSDEEVIYSSHSVVAPSGTVVCTHAALRRVAPECSRSFELRWRRIERFAMNAGNGTAGRAPLDRPPG